MDPEQLWETTMEPATRTLLQVNIDDAVEAERVVSELMGEQVGASYEFNGETRPRRPLPGYLGELNG